MSIVFLFDIFGTIIFAITGAVKGIRNRLDLLGVLFFSITVGCGGGMVRDVLIGATPVAAFEEPAYFIVCIITGLVVFLLSPYFVGRWSIIVYCDAIGLGVFTALGVAKAASMGIGVVGMVMSGTFAAVGGGIIRDVFSKEIPHVFTSDFYATASIVASFFYVLLYRYSTIGQTELLVVTALVATGLRIMGYCTNLRLPVARMYGEKKRR